MNCRVEKAFLLYVGCGSRGSYLLRLLSRFVKLLSVSESQSQNEVVNNHWLSLFIIVKVSSSNLGPGPAILLMLFVVLLSFPNQKAGTETLKRGLP